MTFINCQTKKPAHKADSIQIAIQPFNDIDSLDVEYVFSSIKAIYPKVIINEPIDLPHAAYYKPRNRYKADSILSFFTKKYKANTVFIGLTNKDISTTKGNVSDFGVMGLGLCPGNACVASSFRLSKENKKQQLFKVAIHELGHTQGLPHCNEKYCFMRDAEGKNPTNEEKEFCIKCKTFLKAKGFVM